MLQSPPCPENVGELSALFEIIQRQFPSGRLDRANFGKVFAAGDDAFAQRLWEALDPGGTGCIDFRDYALGASVFCVGSKQEKLQFLFTLCDQDGDGSISLMEFNQMRFTVSRFANTYLSALENAKEDASLEVGLTFPLSPHRAMKERMRAEFEAADVNHDKKLTLQEFTTLFEKGEHEGSGALHDLMESIEERLRLLFVPKQLHIRCALVGPAQCGKSTVVAELTQEEVGSVYRYNKHYNLDGVPVRLEIIDSGQNRAFAYPGIDIVIVLFAIDSHEFSVLDEISQEIARYCPKAVRLFGLTKLDLQQATNEIKYKARDLTAQCAKRLQATQAFQISSSAAAAKGNPDMATPEELFDYAVSCVVPPFLLRPEHVHIRCGMAGPPGGGRSTMIGKLFGLDAVTSHHYQGVVEAESIKADLEVFDSEEYNRALFLADMHVILLVLPVTDTSFKEVEKIANELRTICPDAPIILVGSKIDLRGTTKCISAERGEEWRQKLRLWHYAECSAAADLNVRGVFEEAVRAAVPLFSLTDSGPLSHAHRPLLLTNNHEPVPPAAVPAPQKQQPKAGLRRRPTMGPPSRPVPERPLPMVPPPTAPAEPLYVAQYDYLDDQREGVLRFARFAVITLLEKGDDGWWLGKLPNGQTGYFPGSYVLPVTYTS